MDNEKDSGVNEIKKNLPNPLQEALLKQLQHWVSTDENKEKINMLFTKLFKSALEMTKSNETKADEIKEKLIESFKNDELFKQLKDIKGINDTNDTNENKDISE